MSPLGHTATYKTYPNKKLEFDDYVTYTPFFLVTLQWSCDTRLSLTLLHKKEKLNGPRGKSRQASPRAAGTLHRGNESCVSKIITTFFPSRLRHIYISGGLPARIKITGQFICRS